MERFSRPGEAGNRGRSDDWKDPWSRCCLIGTVVVEWVVVLNVVVVVEWVVVLNVVVVVEWVVVPHWDCGG